MFVVPKMGVYLFQLLTKLKIFLLVGVTILDLIISMCILKSLL